MSHGRFRGMETKGSPEGSEFPRRFGKFVAMHQDRLAHQIGAGGKHQTLAGSSSASGAPKRMSSSMVLTEMHVPWVWRDSSCQAVASANHVAI